MVTIEINVDSDVESPSGQDGNWTHYSFSNRHVNYADPEKFFPNGKPTIGLRRKLKVGLAFLCDYHEHGLCKWDRAASGHRDRWDSSPNAGLLVWEHKPDDMGAKTMEEREKDADAFLDQYTEWCNGNCHYIHATSDDGLDEAIGELIGTEALEEAIKEVLADRGEQEEIEFTGDGAWIADHNDFKGGVPAAEWEAKLAKREVGQNI